MVGPNSQGGNIFFTKYSGPSDGSLLSGGGIVILRVIRRHFLACEDIAGGSELSAGVFILFGVIRRYLLACGHGPSCQPLHVQSTSDGSRSLTMLTTPRREHHGGGRRRGLGTGRRRAGEDATVDAHV